MSGEELRLAGYRRTSRRFGHIARIDRPDWKEHMVKSRFPGSEQEGRDWVETLGEGAADFYRRCVTADRLKLPLELVGEIPSSSGDQTGFIET